MSSSIVCKMFIYFVLDNRFLGYMHGLGQLIKHDMGMMGVADLG